MANAPNTKASPKPATMVAIRGVSCGIVYGAPFEDLDVGRAPAGAVAFGNMTEGEAMMQPLSRGTGAEDGAGRGRSQSAESPLNAMRSVTGSGRLEQLLDLGDGMVGQRLRYLRLHLGADLLVQLQPHLAQHLGRRDQHDLLEGAPVRELVESPGYIVGEAFLADTVPVGFLYGTARPLITVSARLVRALLSGGGVLLLHFLDNLQVWMSGVSPVAKEKRLFAVCHDDPKATFQSDAHGAPPFGPADRASKMWSVGRDNIVSQTCRRARLFQPNMTARPTSARRIEQPLDKATALIY
ncbi:hypothetical protein MPLB_40037 [Mesorhizobium sp. ORS 3324]|nr:hypothetical protein MPLB_40037 [Mesorhizobium sp. ORS 3324]